MLIPHILFIFCALLNIIYGKTLFKRQLDLDKNTAVDNADAVFSKNVDKYDLAQISASEEDIGSPQLSSTSSKRSPEETPNVKNSYVKYKKRRSPYGVVYSQGKPIGILEPISKFYDFQEIEESKEPLKSPAKREEVLLIEDNPTPHEITKRESPKKLEIPQNKIKNIETKANKESKSKRENSEKRLNEIEDNIKEVMTDLGLIGDDKSAPLKRSSRNVGSEEDEDLDSGLNKILLTKEAHSFERNKKENFPSGICANNNLKAKAVHKAEDMVDNNDANIEGTNSKKSKKVADYRSEGEAFLRKKRDQSNPDLMKGLEASGDLTVSGNKSPLASSTVETDKRKVEKEEIKEDKRENEEYAKRLQRNLEKRINEIKEDVKREVKDDKKISDKKREALPKNKKVKSKNRKKRNLMDLETPENNPQINLEDVQEAHIRKRREAKDEDKRISSWSNLNNEDKSDLNKRENLPVSSPQHNPNRYEFEYRTKRDSFSGDNSKKAGEERISNSGFWDAQNQNAAEPENTRAIVTRDSARSAPAASENYLQPMNTNYLDSKRLEKLVSESTSLTKSLKNERAVQNNPIEIELHTGNKDEILKAQKNALEKREKSNSKKDVKKREATLDQNESSDENKYKIFEDANKLDKRSEKADQVNKLDDTSDNNKVNEQNKRDDSKISSGDDSSKISRVERSSKDNKDPSLLSLEDMQKIDSESSSKRKRRNIDYQQPNMQFKNYRADEEEADDESDEFDDDNFDDRTANFIRKRAVDDNYKLRNYVASINSDVYDNPNYLYQSDDSARMKRQVADDIAALHSGGPMVNHLAAVKERNMQPVDKVYRRKRLERMNGKQIKDQSITGLSESDIFGGLPQSYEGELNRFKRVKRDGTD